MLYSEIVAGPVTVISAVLLPEDILPLSMVIVIFSLGMATEFWYRETDKVSCGTEPLTKYETR